MSRKKRVIRQTKIAGHSLRKELTEVIVKTLLKKGKKQLARTILYRALRRIEKETGQDGMDVLLKAIRYLTPLVEIKSRRMGGSVYQVPKHISTRRGISLGVRWLIIAARTKQSKSMEQRLAREIIDASKRRGDAIRKRDEIHRIAENNKAFAHLKT
jgi:small subunit ribosomal protein S7